MVSGHKASLVKRPRVWMSGAPVPMEACVDRSRRMLELLTLRILKQIYAAKHHISNDGIWGKQFIFSVVQEIMECRGGAHAARPKRDNFYAPTVWYTERCYMAAM